MLANNKKTSFSLQGALLGENQRLARLLSNLISSFRLKKFNFFHLCATNI